MMELSLFCVVGLMQVNCLNMVLLFEIIWERLVSLSWSFAGSARFWPTRNWME